MRRKCFDLADKSPVATKVLKRIAGLYAIESEVRRSNADHRRAVRNEHARVILNELLHYPEARFSKVSAKSKLAEAICYAYTRWHGLTVFLTDGPVELDTNTVERSIRPLTLNCKNAMFAGSAEGGDNWSLIATPIETCKISGINSLTWLTNTLTKLAKLSWGALARG